MYPCTRCGAPLNGPVCGRCGQYHATPPPAVPHSAPSANPPQSWQSAPTENIFTQALYRDQAPGPDPYPSFIAPTVPPPAAPPVYPYPAAPEPAPRRRSGLTGLIALCTALALALAVGTWFVLRQDDLTTAEPAPSSAAPSPVQSTSDDTIDPEPEPEPTVEVTVTRTVEANSQATPEEQPSDDEPVVEMTAEQWLMEVRDLSLLTMNPDGRYVAVLSTKADGTVDPNETAANGTHTFHLEDIALLHDQLSMHFLDYDVALSLSSDWGKQPASGEVFWRTYVDLGPGMTKADVEAWCQANFDPAVVANSCLAREMVPPHG